MLGLSDRGFGLNKGIPTLVVAAVSLDAVLAITGFGVCLGITFTSGKHRSIHRITSRLLGLSVTVSFYISQQRTITSLLSVV
jgi:hypothetical protein